MLSKFKTLFKVLITTIIIFILLFGIYRREYISQAIPVYMQYLKQRSKWENINTGTYVYLNTQLNYYFFIENNRLVKLLRYGNPLKLQFVTDLSKSYIYKLAKNNFETRCFFDKKEYLLDKKFDAIKDLVIYNKTFDIPASLERDCHASRLSDILGYLIKILRKADYDKYRYIIIYNKLYAYPITVLEERLKHKDKIVIGVKSPYYSWYITNFIMLPKGTKYTPKVLKYVLNKLYKQEILKHNHKLPKVKTFDTVGGNLIKSAISN